MPLSHCLCLNDIATLAPTERIIVFRSEYTSSTPARATPSRRSRTPTERRNRVSKKSKRKLTDRQERRRIEGLRILARIIARHYLANPHLYRNGADGDGSQSARKEGEA